MFSDRTIRELEEAASQASENGTVLEISSPGGRTFTVVLAQGRADQLRAQQSERGGQQSFYSTQRQSQPQEWRVRKIGSQQSQQELEQRERERQNQQS